MNFTNDVADRYRSSYDIFNYETFNESIDFTLIFDFNKLIKNTNIFDNHKKKELNKIKNKNLDTNIADNYCYYSHDSHEFYNQENPRKKMKLSHDKEYCDMV